jgi:hypothetical protein
MDSRDSRGRGRVGFSIGRGECGRYTPLKDRRGLHVIDVGL